MSSEAWPPQLKLWVGKCLQQMTDSNREEAQTELRQVISEAFTKKTLWTTDWDGVQLQSLVPKPAFQLKRKSDEKLIPAKKKKAKGTNPQSGDFNDQAVLDKRAERFQREHEIERQKSLRGGSQGFASNSNLLNRINPSSRSASPSLWNNDDPEGNKAIDWDKYTIVGSSKELFKDYLRLTSEPDPSTIRPFKVLEKTLIELKKRWRQSNDYPWICNQFKSIRQDLTVQRIRTEFTVQVYEIHARMALEAADMVEFNQCQSMLRNLYELGIPGCNDEFTAYRILMLLHGMNRSDLNLLVGQLTNKQKSSDAIRSALEVQRAMLTNNYHAFFEFYTHAPNMGAYIMDHFVDRERAKALLVMSKAYRQLPLVFIRDELAFENIAQVCSFLETHNAAFYSDPNVRDEDKTWLTKPSQEPLSQIYGEKYRKAVIKGAI